MFSIRSKLVSLLQPWLQSEPDLEVKLGFLRSHGNVKNLCFDISALNRLLDDSACFCFKEVRVQNVNFQFSSWFFPAFTLELSGLYVKLVARKPVGDGYKNKSNWSVKEKKAILSVLDPEGTLLHDAIERISVITSARNSLMSSLLNVILKHCRLSMHDVNLELQLSVTDDTVASFLKIKKLSVEALHLQHTCLLKGLIGVILVPQKVCSLALNVTLFDIGLKREEHANRIFSIDDLSTSIKLKDLRLLDLIICVPQFHIAFSPIDLPILQVSDILTYKEVSRARNGRELWNIAASRIHSLTSNPKLSLCKFVNAARQWLRYVHSYESLLSLIGYPAEIAFEKSSARMSLNKKFSISVKNQLKEISEYEEDLSVAVLARARQIARHRAAIHDQRIARSIQPNLEANKNFFLKILSFLTKTICFIFQLVMHLFFVDSMLNRHSKVDGSSKVVLEDYDVHYCFNIRKVFITVYPISAGPSVIGRTSESPVRISHMNLLSFCVTLDVFSLIYTAGNVAQSIYLSCGDFKVNSTSTDPLKDRNVREEKGHSVKRKMKERRIDSEVIVWGEPAPKSAHTEQVVVDLVDAVGGASFLHMESYLEELWLNWKKFHDKFEGSNAQYIENPFLLCEIKSSLMDQSLDCPQIGLWKCNLSMGKLNIDLEHSSIISMALLLKQIQHVLHHNAGSGGAMVLSQSSGINEPEERKWQDLQTSYASETKMAILRATPEKKIQIGIAIAGPKIRMSLLGGLHNAKEQNVNNIVTQGHSDVYIAFNLENIELCVWPTLKASLGASTQNSKLDDVEFENFMSDAPQLINTTEECLNEKFIYEGSIALDSWIRMSGLTVYLEDLGENQQYQVLGLDSLFIRSLSTRKSTISFPTTVIALSTSLRGMAAGAIVLSYMDEYEMFFQVFECILSALSYAFMNLELLGGVYLCETEEFCGIDPDVFTHLSEKGSFLILKCIQFVIDASFDFGSVDIIIHNSRKNHIVEYYKRTNGVSSKILPIGRDAPEHGIAVAVQKTHAQLLWEEGRVETCIGLSGLQLVIFSHQSQTGEHQNISELRNVLYQSPNCLYEICISSCSLTLCTGSYNAINSHSSGRSNYNAIDDPPLALLSEGSGLQSRDSNRVRSLASDLQLSSCDNLILINIDLGEILMAEHSLRNVLNRTHKETKLLSSLCIPMDDHTISWTIQGGLIILEMTALAMYIRCFSAYFLRIQNAASILPSREFISSGRKSEPVEPYKEMVRQSNHPSKEYHLKSASPLPHSGTCDTPQSKWILSEGLRLTLSQFSLILVIANGSGGVSQFVLEADFLFYIEFLNLRKLSFDLSRLTVVSQHLHEAFQEHTDDVQVLRSSPVADSEFPMSTASGDVSFGFQCTKSVSPICCDASSSSPVPQKEFVVENDIAGHSHFIHGNYILKHAAASVLVEKAASRPDVDQFNIDWIGSGSVSAMDMTISLTEIEMILFLVDSLSDNLSGGDAGNSKQRHRSKNERQNSVSEDKVLDGAIVAIQDLHQHTYFAVDGLENIYRVFGAIHYSLVGEKALFRVEHCSKKRWGSTASWFTLTSLHAKSDLEEPLRLNYRSGSGFVDISSNNDDCSLWRTLDYTRETYEADYDFESDSQSFKHAFYLVNKKCGRAVAFIDGVPEFVKKPGNPFKFKVFPDVSFTPHVLSLDPPLERTHDPDVQDKTHQDEGQTSAVASNLPYISIKMDKVVLTIVHELPDSNDKFPLLQACIDNIQLIVQALSSKARVISTCTATILYFDAQGNMWREIVRPVDMCMFYRCRFEVQSSEIVAKGVPVHFYFRIKQLDVSLTELALDILLFVVGELKMAGPFAVRSSAIFANCCKARTLLSCFAFGPVKLYSRLREMIENQSSLSLICCFYDKQEATVSAKRSASIFIRPVALASRPENSSFLSVQLAALGDFTTSPIHVSLLNARVLAWRTRVISLQDSRSFPGPFVVVDISKTTEDGLSVVVSPLLRVHNETGFSIEILFWRPKQKEAESASVMLRNGDTIDDSKAALDAINLHGGSKKALMSLILGNFLFSCRPVITEQSGDLGESISAEWSEDLKGGKVVCLSGIFDKLNYRFRQALGVKSGKISFSTVRCALSVEGAHITDLHFLIQTIGKDVPVVQPDELRDTTETRTVPVALQEQKEIFLLPTVQVTNYLQSEIHVLLTETQPDLSSTGGCSNIGKQATILCGSSANLYVNPAMIYFTVTLTEFNSSCKAVNSIDWVRKLQKKKSDLNYLDIDLDFGGGKCFASLRLSRSDRGVLEAAIFTSYVLQNDCELSLLCFASGQKPLSRLEIDKFGSSLPPDLGSFLPPKTTRSWFLKSNRMNLKLLDDKTSMALLDMDVLSGFTEVCLETHVGENVTHISKLGVSLKPWNTNMSVPSQIVSIVPRYAVLNETNQTIFIRQCCLEEDLDDTIAVDGKQKAALHMKTGRNRRRERKLLDSLFRKHKNASEDYLIYVQFRLNDTGSSWSGPICIASLGRFFLKFRRHVDSLGSQSSPTTGQESKLMEFAVVHVVEEGPALVLHFDRPLNFTPPYRIENLLRHASITYYQKDSMDQDILGPGSSFGYVWDDLNLPHQLVVQITDMNLSREISLDKVRPWKPFFKVRQQRGLALDLPLEKKSRNHIKDKDESFNLEMFKVGYEVYADGATRVLRICEFPGHGKEDSELHLCAKYQFRVSNFAVHILENKKQEENVSEPSVYSPIVVARLGNINLDSMITDQNKYNQIRIQSINVDEKWVGAPFAAILRRNESDYSDTNENILQIVFVLLSTDSGVQKVKYASTVLQPLRLNLDEETLMRFVPFWRTSLSTSSTSQQYYFEHFEIHPIKVVASFLPGSSDGNYSSSQETLRSFLHSVIKIPAVKDKNVELNGILLTHAMVTVRELCLKCAQHYSWYAMRAVYIAKGSPLLPPAFASIFDDSASSSLDIFFDPSSGVVNVPGITIGMFKFISKCIDKKGFSGTKRYFGDLGKTIKTAGSNVLFAAVTEISDCVLKGAEANGFKGMMNGFHQGILRLAMEPSVLRTAVMEGGPDRKIKLDRSPGVDELYIEGYLQAMLDTIYKQEYLRVRVIDNQVILKNLPPNSSLLNEIMERVKSFLISKALLQGDPSTACHPLSHLRGETEWKIGPTILTLWEHLFVSFAIRMLRKRAVVYMANTNWKKISGGDSDKAIVPTSSGEKQGIKLNLKWGVRKFVFSGIVAYLDGRLCRCIPNAIVRRIVSGFLLSLLDDNNGD